MVERSSASLAQSDEGSLSCSRELNPHPRLVPKPLAWLLLVEALSTWRCFLPSLGVMGWISLF